MKVFCTLICLLAMCAPAAHAQSRGDLDAQLKLLMQWWPGDYDNNEQIVRQSGGGLETPTDKPFYRLHSRFQTVKLPALGANVLYLEEYRDNDSARTASSRCSGFTRKARACRSPTPTRSTTPSVSDSTSAGSIFCAASNSAQTTNTLGGTV